MSQTITFLEQNTGTVNPVYQAKSETVTFSGTVSAAPAAADNAVLLDPAGTVTVSFSTAVSFVSLNALFVPPFGTATVTFRDAAGNVLSAQDNAASSHFEFGDRDANLPNNIASVTISDPGRAVGLNDVTFVNQPTPEAQLTVNSPGPAPTTANDINGLLWGYEWNTHNLTYSFPTVATENQYLTNGYQYDPANFAATGNKVIAGFQALSMQQQTAVESIFSNISAVANLTFTLTANANADLRFAEAKKVDTGNALQSHNIPSAETEVLDPSASAVSMGDMWFNTTDYNNPHQGNFAETAGFMHEIGHALGLKHGHQTGSAHGAHFPRITADHDSLEFTVMTYHHFVGEDLALRGERVNDDYPQTLMQDDIATLQYLYGANYNTNSGDTTYSWSPTSGVMSINGVAQAVPPGNAALKNVIFMTVWDGGGNDTYDFSSYSGANTRNLTIDLNPGRWTSLGNPTTDPGHAQTAALVGTTNPNDHFARGNIANALLFNNNIQSLIENANGGAGNDTITGNQVDNVLNGNAGNDTISGLAGNDTINGGAGADTLLGGDGADTISGGTENDTIEGGRGSDTISGDAGNDTIYAGTKADNVPGGSIAGDDTISGGDGNDTLVGGLGNDTIHGGNDNDTIDAGAGHNTVTGDAGNDTITSIYGIDNIDGGGGDDTVIIKRPNLSAVVNLNFDPLAGGTYTLPDGPNGAVGTQFTNVENLQLATGSGNDQITFKPELGMPGQQSLDAGGGDDTVAVDFSAFATAVDAFGGARYTVRTTVAGQEYGVSLVNVEHLTLVGGSGNDTLDVRTFGSGDTRLVGGPGSDLLNGSGANEVAVFSDGAVNYNFTGLGSANVIVQEVGGSDGTDFLNDIRYAEFAGNLFDLVDPYRVTWIGGNGDLGKDFNWTQRDPQNSTVPYGQPVLFEGVGLSVFGSVNPSWTDISSGTDLTIVGYTDPDSGQPQVSGVSSGVIDLDGSLTVGARGSVGASDFRVTGTLTIGADGSVGGANMYVGSSSGPHGTISQNAGSNLGDCIILGDTRGTTGDYNLSGGNITQASQEIVGNGGTGNFVQSGGDNTADEVDIGNQGSGQGNYTLQVGTLNGLSVYVGVEGQGVFTQNGGTSNSNVVLGFLEDGVGTYNLNAGDLSGGVTVGAQGTGTFIQAGGSNDTELVVGDAFTGSGTYTFDDGTLTADDEIIARNGIGRFNQNTGTNAISAFLDVGEYSGAEGTYNFSFGDLSASSETIGDQGAGEFIQTSDGSNIISHALTLGNATGGMGTYVLHHGSLQLSGLSIGQSHATGTFQFNPDAGDDATLTFQGGVMTVGSGAGATGSFYQRSGDIQLPISGVGLTIGASGGNGVYELDSGSLAANQELIGQSGTGSLIQNGGINTVRTNGGLSLGDGGSYDLEQGTLTSHGTEGIGVGGIGAASFEQAGGTHDADGLFVGTAGQYELDGGTLTVGNLNEYLGGGFLQTGGTHTISGVLSASYFPASSYDQEGGSFSTTAEYVGISGTGEIDQYGGTSAVSDRIVLGGTDASVGIIGDGSYCLGGDGDLTVGEIFVGSDPGATGTFSFNENLDDTIEDSARLHILGGADPQGLIVGGEGIGTFIHGGGDLLTSLVVGRRATGIGTYELDDGTLTTPNGASEILGDLGNGTFEQFGGINTVVNADLVIGRGGAGFYNLSGPGSHLVVTGNGHAIVLASQAGSSGQFTVGSDGLTDTVNLDIGPGGQGIVTTRAGGLINVSTLVDIHTNSLINTAAGAIDVGAGLTPMGGVLQVDNGGALSGAGKIIGNLIEGAGGSATASAGTLTITGNVSGAGAPMIGNIGGIATLEIGGSDAGHVQFNSGAGATLKLDQPALFTGAIDGLVIGNVIDLTKTFATQTHLNGSTLVVTLQGGATLSYLVSGDLTNNYFAIQTDGQGGSDLVLTKGVGPSPGVLFSNQPDQVDFNYLSPEQQAAISSGADLYHALDGGDAAYLPNLQNMTGIAWNSSQVFDAGAGNDWVAGGNGNDVMNGGLGKDVLTGGAGADDFVFDGNALTDAQAGLFDRVVDVDQGNGGLYSSSEHDQIDLSAILSAAYNAGSGQPMNALVRLVESATEAGSLLQVDSDGNNNSNHWTTIAELDGIHQGQTVNVILAQSLPSGSNILPLTDASALGDFNGDRIADVLWRNDNGATAIWQMNNGAVDSVSFPAGVGNDWHIVGLGDFNGDLSSDILWRNDDGTALEWQMSGGAIQSAPVIGVEDAASWIIGGIGDLDGDGKSDIVWKVDQGNGSFNVVTWTLDGATTSTSGTSGTLSNAWGIAGIGDFNGDGKNDILFRNAGDATTAIWNMNGVLLSMASFELGVPTDWHVVGVGDFNGDHTSDILWQNDAGVIAIWQMANDQPASAGFFGVGTDWHIVGVGDMDHDGKSDILWRNDSGATAISLMNGTSVNSTTFPGGVPSDWEPTTHHYDFV